MSNRKNFTIFSDGRNLTFYLGEFHYFPNDRNLTIFFILGEFDYFFKWHEFGDFFQMGKFEYFCQIGVCRTDNTNKVVYLECLLRKYVIDNLGSRNFNLLGSR